MHMDFVGQPRYGNAFFAPFMSAYEALQGAQGDQEGSANIAQGRVARFLYIGCAPQGYACMGIKLYQHAVEQSGALRLLLTMPVEKIQWCCRGGRVSLAVFLDRKSTRLNSSH